MTPDKPTARISALHHFTIRCSEPELDALQAFYTRHLGLTIGARPKLPMPGYWLYAGGHPIVHLYAISSEPIPNLGGPLDHIALRAHDLNRTRAYFHANGIPFDEAPVPGWPLHQLFVKDPSGLKIELTFDL